MSNLPRCPSLTRSDAGTFSQLVQHQQPFRLLLRSWEQGGPHAHAVLWTSTRNEAELPLAFPPYNVESMIEDYEPSQIQCTQWAKNLQPHLPFVPIGFQFVHPLFQRFAYTFDSLPIIFRGGQWQLDPDVACTWQRMEEGMIFVASTLLSGKLVPLDSWKQYPSSYGYLRRHFSEKFARRCAWMSRAGFRELVGYCRYAIALQRSNWKQVLVERDDGQTFNPGWLDELDQVISPYPTFGAIIDPCNCGWIRQVEQLHLQCPLWFLAATVTANGAVTMRPDHLLPGSWVRPLPDNIHEFLQNIAEVDIWIRQQPLEEKMLCVNEHCCSHLSQGKTQIPMAEADDGPPQPHPESGQLFGESWELFFARRYQDRRTRNKAVGVLNQEECLKLSQIVGHDWSAARFFYWDIVHGFWIRKPIPDSRFEEIWSAHLPSQQRYDPVTREWDLCKALSRTYENDSMQQASEPIKQVSFIDYTPEASITFTKTAGSITKHFDEREMTCHTVNPQPPSSSLLEDLENTYRPAIQKLQYRSISTCNIMHILSHRYGFTSPPTGFTPPHSEMTIAKATNLLGDATAEVSSDLSPSISAFISAVLARHRPLDQLWDLSQSNARYLKSQYTTITHEYRKYKVTRPGIKEAELSLFSLLPHSQDGCADENTIVLTEDASTVLQCTRQVKSISKRDIIEHLVSNGNRFYLLYFNTSVIRTAATVTHGFSYRPRGYKAKPVDYALYEQERDRLLTPAVARAALKRGGILWRLAREKYPDTSFLVDSILSPSEEAGYCEFRDLNGHTSMVYHDDYLSEQEENIICGVYYLYTNTSNTQKEDISWWPKPSAWENSGHNVGFWSPNAERWFQRRMDQIRAGEAQLRNASQWREGVKFQKKALDFTRAHTSLAHDFILGTEYR